MQSPQSQSVVVSRTYVDAIVAAGPGFDTANNYFFSPSLIPGASEISAMFNEFKLMSMTLRWIPAFTQAVAGNISSQVMYICYNPNNFTTGVPTSGSIRERSLTKIHNLTQTFSVQVKPVIKNQVGQAGVATYYQDIPCDSVWMSTDSLSARYYGLDWLIPDTGLAAAAPLGKWEMTYHIVVRGVA